MAKKIAFDVDAHKDVLAWIYANDDHNNFAYSLANAYSNYGKLTPAQVAAVRKNIAREEEWEAKKAAEQAALEAAGVPDVPEGKQTVTGEVLTLKWKDSQFGSTLKMLVRTEAGYKVWGTVPNSLIGYDQLMAGTKVQITATFERSKDDPKFGFFKRPKANFVEAA